MPFEIYFFRFDKEDVVPVVWEKVEGVLRRYDLSVHLTPTYAELNDGLSIEFYANGFEAGNVEELTIATRGFSALLGHLVFDLMTSTGMTVILPSQPPTALVTASDSIAELPAGSFDPVLTCSSPEQVIAATASLYGTWSTWAGVH